MINGENIIPAFKVIYDRYKKVKNNTFHDLKPFIHSRRCKAGKNYLAYSDKGYLDKRLSEFFEVSVSTIARYKRKGWPAIHFILIEGLLADCLEGAAGDNPDNDQIYRVLKEIQWSSGIKDIEQFNIILKNLINPAPIDINITEES